jgi:proteasome lid subunit RPN8/RPN11
MVLQISPAQIRAMQHHVSTTYPQEGCGVLLGQADTSANQRRVMEVRPVANAWSDEVERELADSGIVAEPDDQAHSRRDRYWIDPRDLLALQRYTRSQQLSLIGIYHSHPDHAAVPSECDRALAWTGYAYIIISVLQGQPKEPRCWQLDDHHQFQPEPLVVKSEFLMP